MPKELRKNEKKRLPPGQRITERFPVLQNGIIPKINHETYLLEIEGEIENPCKFSLKDLQKMKDAEIEADIHCVTSWSKLDTKWSGIYFTTLIENVKPTENANFVEFTGADGGFTTTVPYEELKKNNAILAIEYENKPITDAHGGPVRVVLPDLYFYKSAKWVVKIKFLKKDNPGYWERGGYSNKADPWKEQRYSYQD